MMCCCRLMKAAIVELQWRIKSWQKLHPPEKSDALGAVQTPPLLPTSIHIPAIQNLNTSIFSKTRMPPSLSTRFSYRFLRCLRGVPTQKVIFRKKNRVTKNPGDRDLVNFDLVKVPEDWSDPGSVAIKKLQTWLLVILPWLMLPTGKFKINSQRGTLVFKLGLKTSRKRLQWRSFFF